MSVGQCHATRLEDVGDVVLTDDHLGGVEVDFILVVALRLAQGVVAIDVFGVGQGGVAAHIAFGLLVVGRRVAVGTIKLLVTRQDASVDFVFRRIPVIGAEVMVIIARRVVEGFGVGC